MKNKHNNNQNFKTPFNKGVKVVSPCSKNKRTHQETVTIRVETSEKQAQEEEQKVVEKEVVDVKTKNTSFLNAIVGHEQFIPVLLGVATVLAEAFRASKNIKPIK